MYIIVVVLNAHEMPFRMISLLSVQTLAVVFAILRRCQHIIFFRGAEVIIYLYSKLMQTDLSLALSGLHHFIG